MVNEQVIANKVSVQVEQAETERVERMYEMLQAAEPRVKVRIWSQLEQRRIKRIETGQEGTYTPAKRLPAVKHWNQLTEREYQDLWSACEDGQIAVFSGGKKPPKFDAREWVSPSRIKRLESAKLVRLVRLELYPDNLDLEATCYIPTTKGKKWREERGEHERKQDQDHFLKIVAESTNPDLQKLHHDIQLAEKVSQLPEAAQQAIKTFLDILTLQNQWAWMKNTVTPEMVANGKDIMGVMVLAFFETQPENLRKIALNALKMDVESES